MSSTLNGVCPGPQELLDNVHELVGVCPDERVSGAIDDHELRTTDPIVKHLRMVHRHRLILRRPP